MTIEERNKRALLWGVGIMSGLLLAAIAVATVVAIGVIAAAVASPVGVAFGVIGLITAAGCLAYGSYQGGKRMGFSLIDRKEPSGFLHFCKGMMAGLVGGLLGPFILPFHALFGKQGVSKAPVTSTSRVPQRDGQPELGRSDFGRKSQSSHGQVRAIHRSHQEFRSKAREEVKASSVVTPPVEAEAPPAYTEPSAPLAHNGDEDSSLPPPYESDSKHDEPEAPISPDPDLSPYPSAPPYDEESHSDNDPHDPKPSSFSQDRDSSRYPSAPPYEASHSENDEDGAPLYPDLSKLRGGKESKQ